jgi:hypothetical protein
MCIDSFLGWRSKLDLLFFLILRHSLKAKKKEEERIE